jgi:nicotinate-nucleotide adenylyltransferase
LSHSARRLGLYGGAFDPPHLAHSALAQAAVQQFALDELWLLPMGQAWYKSRSLSAAEHRVKMLELAFADLPQARVDGRETQRSGPSYTYDTLIEIRHEQPNAALFLLIGQDQLDFFEQWHRHTDILQLATLLVAYRADSVRAGAPDLPKTQGKIAHLPIQMPRMDISATSIRDGVAHGQSVDHLVKPAVARYIAQHRLYSLPSKTS